MEISDRPIYHLYWNGPVVAKARPRSTRDGRVYTDPRYEAMKSAATSEFICQWRDLGQPGPIAYPIRPYVFAWGKHHQAQDVVDNLPGVFYDALVDARVLQNDSMKWCPGSVHEMAHSRCPPRVDILLAPWLPFARSMAQFSEICDWLAIASRRA